MTAAKQTETQAAKKTTAKKAAPKKAAPEATTSKKAAGKPKTEKVAKQSNKDTVPKPNRVFAIRISDDELAAIHRAAGPRNATRFIRAVAAAFAAEDERAFKTIVEEARQARS